MVNYDYLYNKNFFESVMHKDSFCPKKLHFKIIDNGTILPYKKFNGIDKLSWGGGGIINENGEFFEGSTVFRGSTSAYTPTEEIEYIDSAAVYVGTIHYIWGHALTDGLKLMWFLNSGEYKKNFDKCSIVYTMWGDENEEREKREKSLINIIRHPY